MSIDVPPAALRDIHIVDDDTERVATWAETVITVVATIATVAIVSFVAVLMAIA